jgi:hypothetical protein
MPFGLRAARRLAALTSLALCGAVLAPAVRAPDDDDFPLSTYPMFAAPRPRELTMASARGVTRDGQPRTLSPGALGTDEVMQAFATLQRAAAAGPDERAALCAAIAARVARDAALGDAVAVEIVVGSYDAVAAMAQPAAAAGLAGGEASLARCDVVRGAP